MYRSALWTMRQYSGQSTSESTNERFKYLLKNGQTGLSLAFDLPTQIGLDSDMPLAEDDVGKLGVAVDTLDDFERIFDGIALDEISTSFTINAHGADHPGDVCPGGPEAGGRDQEAPGDDPERHPEGVHRPRDLDLPARSRRSSWWATWSSTATGRCPRFNAISVSGTHILEYGANTMQAVALAIAIAEVYIEEVLKRGSQYRPDRAPLLVPSADRRA